MYHIKRNAWLIKELRKFIQNEKNIKLSNNKFITVKIGNIVDSVYIKLDNTKYFFDGIEFEIMDLKTENYNLVSYVNNLRQFNNYLTVDKFAEHNQLTPMQATQLLEIGKQINWEGVDYKNSNKGK